MPRQASDDSTSVGKKCLRANVLLPDPLGPIRTTRDRLGMEIFMVQQVSAWLRRTHLGRDAKSSGHWNQEGRVSSGRRTSIDNPFARRNQIRRQILETQLEIAFLGVDWIARLSNAA